jgi:hypothetical protein
MKHLIAGLLVISLIACGEQKDAPDTVIAEKAPEGTSAETSSATYEVAAHFPGSEKDTLLANMITFIYKRPNAAINRDRTDPEFRSYYVSRLGEFEFVHHHFSADSTHWFYLIRPARSVDGDKRGVGGRFRTNEALEMVEFEEIFNTPIMTEEALRRTGRILFEEMIATGNVDAYSQDRGMIEWPDDRLKYDKEKREWRYNEGQPQQQS